MASVRKTGDSWGKEGVQGSGSTSILKAGGQEEALNVWKLSEQSRSPIIGIRALEKDFKNFKHSNFDDGFLCIICHLLDRWIAFKCGADINVSFRMNFQMCPILFFILPTFPSASDMRVPPLQEVGITATSWVTSSSCSA